MGEPGEVESQKSLEERLAAFEKRFIDLEARYLSRLAKETQSEDKKNDDEKSSDDGGPKEPVAESNTDKDTTPVPNATTPIPESRVRVVVSKVAPDGGREEHVAKSDNDGDATKASMAYASTIRKVLGDGISTIEIHSQNLIEMLRRLLQKNPWHTFLGDIVILYAPYEDLLQNWDLLLEEAQKEVKDETEQSTRRDLHELMQAILKDSGDEELDKYLKTRDSLKKQKSITFEALWTIFPPGTIVYGKLFLGHEQIFITEDCIWLWPSDERTVRGRAPRTWELRCWTYDWHENQFQRRSVTLTFKSFDGQKPISELPYHPLEENKDCEEIRRRLNDRGKRFRELCTTRPDQKLHKYKGPAMFDKKGFQRVQTNDPDSDDEDSYRPSPAPKSASVSSDVMVDFDSYHKYGPGFSVIGEHRIRENTTQCFCTDCKENKVLKEVYHNDYDNMTGAREEKWEQLQYMLCPPRVLGYVLKDKQWAQLDVSKISDVSSMNPAKIFDKLHLAGEYGGKETKELLQGLVRNHGSSYSSKNRDGYNIADIVPEKGQGLVVLLYGTPGVGKTSTAQTVAIATGKPLLSIGVGDVGTAAKQMESNLELIFDLATTWKAILLIDEADVFLQSRTKGALGPSTERSAIVSVFLRVLEYYQGILFLTTNQIAQFDVAVQSRIHIAIKYNPLNQSQTLAIFEQFLRVYDDSGRVKEYNELVKVAKRELNRKEFDGRQIRNIVTSAMGYAASMGEKLDVDHLQHVIGIAEEFKKDLAYQMMQWKEAQNSTRPIGN